MSDADPTTTTSEGPRQSLATPRESSFAHRHVGPRPHEVDEMLAALDVPTLQALIDETVPESIRLRRPLNLPAARDERQALADLRNLADRNRVFRSFIGMGYSDCITPPVILRNVLENPGWYTQYTPYQAEISQGRLEALLNFQTLVTDLTGLPLANASLLDEATAAAEAMGMCCALARGAGGTFFVDSACHPQTIAVIRTRAGAAGIAIDVTDVGALDSAEWDTPGRKPLGVLVQYPTSDGQLIDYAPLAEGVHAAGGKLVVATDLLALTLLRPPGEFGADIAIGSSQRFGVPMGFGGPHAAFLATRDEFRRQIPGRIVGVSHDAAGAPALRLALQTREQHIRRDKATSNICTAQVLLAVIAGLYAAYHGPRGLREIALRVHRLTRALATGLERLGCRLAPAPFFDTLRIQLDPEEQPSLIALAAGRGMNLRRYDGADLGIALDETTTSEDVVELLELFAGDDLQFSVEELLAEETQPPEAFVRESSFLEHPVFGAHHSEHEMLRYVTRLQSRDLSLTTSMIPLGSCTMKLNATSEMIPVTWPEFGGLHPYAPEEQTEGYVELFAQLESWLAEISGFTAVSLQPNAGSQGELAGLLAIRAYHESRGEQRDVCLIPVSAHGTNPASAAMAGMRVVSVACDNAGNIDLDDLREKATTYRDALAALMVTYPSTHGVFEEAIRDICAVIHAAGGQVYLDGANMNAQVGLARPGDFGADVCHLNLHKTFCIPHGGGGPGVGPIGVAEQLAAFLPGHPLEQPAGVGALAAAPWGSSSILPISWMYIAMMGPEGLREASEIAILNANYMAHRLAGAYDILFTGAKGRVAHEFIMDCRPFKSCGIEVEDIAKRLMDYGFHAPTMSFPVPGTLMVEPTESESKAELDRLCDALLQIREEIRAVENGISAAADSPLKHAPHTAQAVTADDWTHPYSRRQAAFPTAWTREHKFWPAVARIDNAYGDRNLFCTCPPLEADR